MANLQDLSSNFDGRVECLRTLVDLQYASEEVDCNRNFENLLNEVEKLENIMVMMKSLMNKQREECSQIEELKSVFKDLIDHLQYSCVNVPVHMPQPTNKEPVLQEIKITQNVNKTNNSKNNLAKDHGKGNTTKKQSKKTGKCDVYIPTVEYVTIDEFETVPKYMKGRLTYSNLNAAIDELNKPYKEKYKILSFKRSSLNDVNRKRYEKYKLQETKDTSGEYFIVDEDIKEFSTLKLDSVGRSILTVLRHCGRLKEIRGNGHTRYACLPIY